MLHRVVTRAAELYYADGPDFSNIGPDSKGVPKSGIVETIAEVLMYFGLAVLFIVLLVGLIGWGMGNVFKNSTWGEDNKVRIFKAAGGAVLVTAAGAFWTWIIKL